jgi:hypothetical protein
MKIIIPMQEKYGRDAEITLEDRAIDQECPDTLRRELQIDLDAFLKVIGAVTAAIIEDTLHPVPGRSKVLDDVMSLMEQYIISKIQCATKFHPGPNRIQ